MQRNKTDFVRWRAANHRDQVNFDGGYFRENGRRRMPNLAGFPAGKRTVESRTASTLIVSPTIGACEK